MSERITAANLDEVIKRNEVIEEQMKQSASLIWSKYNPMQINSPIQLALQILRPYGLIQLPIDKRSNFCSGWKTNPLDKYGTSESKSVFYGVA